MEVQTQCTQPQVDLDLIIVFCQDTIPNLAELLIMIVPKVANVCSHLKTFLYLVLQVHMMLMAISHANHVLKVKFVQLDKRHICQHLVPETAMEQCKLAISHLLELMLN